MVADAGSALGRAIATGTMAGRADTAREKRAAPGLDAAVTWTAPSAGTFSFDTAGSDRNNNTWLHVHRAACNGLELACNDTASGIQAAARSRSTRARKRGGGGRERQPHAPAVQRARCELLFRPSGFGHWRGDGGPVGVGGSLFANCAQSGRDVTVQWTAPPAGVALRHFWLDYDTVLHVRDGACGATIPGATTTTPAAIRQPRRRRCRGPQVVTAVISASTRAPKALASPGGGGTGAYVLNINRL